MGVDWKRASWFIAFPGIADTYLRAFDVDGKWRLDHGNPAGSGSERACWAPLLGDLRDRRTLRRIASDPDAQCPMPTMLILEQDEVERWSAAGWIGYLARTPRSMGAHNGLPDAHPNVRESALSGATRSLHWLLGRCRGRPRGRRSSQCVDGP